MPHHVTLCQTLWTPLGAQGALCPPPSHELRRSRGAEEPRSRGAVELASSQPPAIAAGRKHPAPSEQSLDRSAPHAPLRTPSRPPSMPTRHLASLHAPGTHNKQSRDGGIRGFWLNPLCWVDFLWMRGPRIVCHLILRWVARSCAAFVVCRLAARLGMLPCNSTGPHQVHPSSLPSERSKQSEVCRTKLSITNSCL